jgi:hypothetical protein
MEQIRKFPKEIGLARVFRPGRLRHQSLAAAYERLIPPGRRLGRQERPRNHGESQEAYRWA